MSRAFNRPGERAGGFLQPNAIARARREVACTAPAANPGRKFALPISSTLLLFAIALAMSPPAVAQSLGAGPVVELTGPAAATSSPASGNSASPADNGSVAIIPPVQSSQPAQDGAAGPPPAAVPADVNVPDAAKGEAAGANQIEEYEAAQNPALPPVPHLHSLREFMSEGADSSPIGLELREDRRKLKSGEQADGLLILKVDKGSPAAEAGLRAYSTTGHTVLEGAALAAAMIFPPAVLAIAILDQTHVGESYDMIIGVDGRRVTNYMDFEDETRDIKPGDVVYLSIVRDGKRMQVPVTLPSSGSPGPAAAAN